MEKYQIKSEIEHILDRPGMYMGSTNNEVVELMLYQPSTNKIISVKNSVYNAGLMKLFDEIMSNSVDEHRRKDSLFRIDRIKVTANDDGYIKIWDNGGIPVQNHKQTGILIPELIFGHLRTSSNYDDSQERDVIGTNGLGAKLTNIFSTEFIVETADGKNKVIVKWTDNMRNIETSEIVPTKEHYTCISFKIDLKRFDIDKLLLSTIRQMQKRCIDACACNPNLTIDFETNIADGKLNTTWKFDTFEDYVNLYLEPEQRELNVNYNVPKLNITLQPSVLASSNGKSNENIAFVNGALCCNGTHIKIIQKQIVDKILEYCKKNEMELITEKDVIQRMTLFINCSVKNPTYDSQTKECLTNKLSAFDLKLSDKYIKEILDSEIINVLKDFYSVKYAEEQKKETRKLNNIIKSTKKNTKKLISASGSSTHKELWIFEGNSASNGFRKYRNPLTQSAYLLRGKIRNTFDLKRNQILENQELREIIALLGLLFNEPSKNLKNLKYDKIIVDSDADYDGHHICGLFLAFVAKHFPELIKAGKIYRALSPIIIAFNTKTHEKLYYYTLDEFESKKHLINMKDYEIRYTKGLGGLDDDDYNIMLRQQKLLQFSIEDITDMEYINIWFEKSAIQRKEILLGNEEEHNYEE